MMRKRRRWLSTVMLIWLFCGCDRIYALLQKEGAEELALVGEVDPYSRNEKVEEVQRLLKLYGYRVGKPDGVLGANTRRALEDFQRDNNLKETRFIDDDTWEKLHMFEPSGLVVQGKINIKAVQQALSNAGFDAGAIDGKAGKKTQASLQNFQKACRLKVDGRIGFKTLRRLAEYLPVENPPQSSKK